MGLDVRVRGSEDKVIDSECFGAYSGYAAWRRAIAQAKGFNIDDMDGFGGKTPWTDQPFQLILNHSDCDDGYSLEQIPEVLQEVEEIKKLGVDNYEQSDKFIRLCKVALENKKPLVFE